MKPEQAWLAMRGQLQAEMPKSTFDTWVRDAEFISGHDGYFIVGVQNGYARDWLEKRLTKTISRLLTGILGKPCEVSFVVHQATVTNTAATAQHQEDRLQRAFATTLASLRTQSSLSDYESHIKHLRLDLQAAERGAVTIIAPNPDTLQWINAYLRLQFETLFCTSYGETIQMNFESASATDPLQGASAEETIALYMPLVRLREIFLKDNVGHRYPRYLLRWMPYIGTNALWTLLALRQAHFEQHHCLPENGRRIQVSLRALADSIGADKNTIQSHRDSGVLDWFIEHIPTERYQVVAAGKVHREAHAYVFHNTVPFTPADQKAISAWLVEHDFASNPLGALTEALRTQPKELLASELPASAGTQIAPSKATTLQNTLLALCQGTLSTVQRAQILRRIEELQGHIIEGLGYSFVTLYFMKHWLPRLGHSAAAFVLLCRQNIYVNEDDGEYRERLSFPAGQAGLAPYAQLLGKSLKTIKRLLPPVEYEDRAAPGRKASHHQSESNRAASQRIKKRKQKTAAFIYRAVKRKTGALMLYVNKRDPLIPDHQHEYDSSLLLVSHFLGKYGLSFSEEDIDAFLAALDRAGLFKLQDDITHNSDIDIPHISDNAITHVSDRSIAHDSDIGKTHNSDIDIPHISDNGIALFSDISKTHDSDNFLKTLKLPLFKYLTKKSLRNYLNKQLSNNIQQDAEKPEFLWTKGVGAVWNERHLYASGIFQKTELVQLKQQAISPEIMIAWVLYIYSQQGTGIKQPGRFLMSRFADSSNSDYQPSPGPGYARLAALGPKKLQTLIRNCEKSTQGVALKRQVSGYADWLKLMAPEADLDQVYELAEVLGLGNRG